MTDPDDATGGWSNAATNSASSTKPSAASRCANGAGARSVQRHRQRHPPGRAALAHQHQLRALPATLQDDRQTLPGQRVERMGDNNRVRNRARTRRTGPMRGPSGCPGGGACRRSWGSSAPARATGSNRPGLEIVSQPGEERPPAEDDGARLSPHRPRPSVPPCCPAPDSHATTRKAGSQTRLYRSSNRR